jgi:hypothetical protein
MAKTKKITVLDRTNSRIIGDTARKALIDSLKSMGISVSQKGGTIYPDKLTLKFEFFIPSVKEAAKKDGFVLMAPRYGLKASDLNKKFKLRTKTMKVTGISPRRYSKPIDVVDQNGKQFIMRASDVVRLLKSAPVK